MNRIILKTKNRLSEQHPHLGSFVLGSLETSTKTLYMSIYKTLGMITGGITALVLRAVDVPANLNEFAILGAAGFLFACFHVRFEQKPVTKMRRAGRWVTGTALGLTSLLGALDHSKPNASIKTNNTASTAMTMAYESERPLRTYFKANNLQLR